MKVIVYPPGVYEKDGGSRPSLFFKRAPSPSIILTHLNVVSRGKLKNFFDTDKKLKGSRFLMA